MSITAMKQWLKALEHTSPLIDDVITAKASLRQAIEQAEKQKPVAWMTINAYGEEDDIHYENPEGHLPEGWTYKPLYTRPQPVAQMRMPKIGDRVICIEDESLATVESLTGGGSPDIKFDDGSHGTYLLREFAELFCYADTTPQPQQAEKQEPLAYLLRREDRDGYETGEKTDYGAIPVYTTPQPQREWVGLTDEEVKALVSWWPSYDQMPALMVLVKDIQNSIKEKNT